ncbi:MAG: hypothetical protein OHK0021_02760 [Bryobacter sp.]
MWAALLPLAAQTLLRLPEYSAQSIVNAASQGVGRITPNSIITIYGQNLSFETWALGAGDIRNGNLPTDAPGLNVTVAIRGLPVPLYYISPTQINALIPANFTPGVARLEISRGSARGPRVEFEIVAEAPEFFAFEGGWAAATHPDGRTVSAAAPAVPGEFIVVYGTAWGAVETSLQQQHIAASGALLRRWPDVRIHLGEREVLWPEVFYAGLTPGFAGLYQVNFRIPVDVEGEQPLRIEVAGSSSEGTVKIPVATKAPTQAFHP